MVKVIFFVLNVISLVAGVVSILMLMILGWKRPIIMKRVSLQLQTGVALLDITRHIRVFNLHESEDKALCILTAFYGFFSDHLYVFLNIGIALNLHLILLKRIKPQPVLKWIYWIAALGISSIINYVPYSLNYLGKSSDDYCFLIMEIPNRELVKFFLVHLINWPGTIYCLIISLIVLYQYRFNTHQEKEKTIFCEPEIRQLSWTIALYPLTCFITMIGYLTYNSVYDGFNYHSDTLAAWMLLGFSGTGLINLLSLLVDYQVRSTLKSLYTSKEETVINLELDDKQPTDSGSQIKRNEPNNILNSAGVVDSYEEQRECLIRFL